MIEIEFKGEIYKRYNGKWVDDSFMVVVTPLQRELNRLYVQTVDFKSMDVQTLVKEGDMFKSNNDFILAVEFYEEASKICDKETLSYILPRITSCYRKNSTPQKAIDFFAFAKGKYGANIISSALLTSAAAAYCDLKEYDKATKCAKIAYAKKGGKADEDLLSVFRRIKREAR